MIEKHLCIIGTQNQTEQGLKNQIKEVDLHPEDQYFQKCSFNHQHQKSPGS